MSASYGFAAFADAADCCATCGGPADDEHAVIRDSWRVCGPCRDEWVEQRRWIKLAPEQAHHLIAAGAEIECGDCGTTIRPGGPIRVWTNLLGEVAQAFCGACVRNYAERKKQEALQAEILDRVGKGRSKGLLTKELLAEGRSLVDVRLAFEALLDDGRLVQVKRGIVRRRKGQAPGQQCLPL